MKRKIQIVRHNTDSNSIQGHFTNTIRRQKVREKDCLAVLTALKRLQSYVPLSVECII